MPCGRCGVRADLGCKHQPAEGPTPPAIALPGKRKDGRSRPPVGQGLSMHLDRLQAGIPAALKALKPNP